MFKSNYIPIWSKHKIATGDIKGINNKRKVYKIKSAKYRLRINAFNEAAVYSIFERIHDYLTDECQILRGFGWGNSVSLFEYDDETKSKLAERKIAFANFEKVQSTIQQFKHWRKHIKIKRK